MIITDIQLGTILAALRYWQEATECHGLPIVQADIATGGGEFEALTPEEIDDLCNELKCSTQFGVVSMSDSPPITRETAPPRSAAEAARRDREIIKGAATVLSKYTQ